MDDNAVLYCNGTRNCPSRISFLFYKQKFFAVLRWLAVSLGPETLLCSTTFDVDALCYRFHYPNALWYCVAPFALAPCGLGPSAVTGPTICFPWLLSPNALQVQYSTRYLWSTCCALCPVSFSFRLFVLEVVCSVVLYSYSRRGHRKLVRLIAANTTVCCMLRSRYMRSQRYIAKQLPVSEQYR